MSYPKLQKGTLPEELREECYCPSCGSILRPIETVDPWAVCLSCTADHRFFVLPTPPLAADSATAASACFPQATGQDFDAVAYFWLSESEARSILNEQLAELLRVILEGRSLSKKLPFLHCPICSGPLSAYEQPDIWVQGLCCPEGHTWASRGGRLMCVFGRDHFILHREPSDEVVRQLVVGWLKGFPVTDSNLPESVRAVLRNSRFGMTS